MKNESNVFFKSLILSLLFGIMMGIIFPFFTLIFVKFPNKIIFYIFFIACITAGIITGVACYFITRIGITSYIKKLTASINSSDIKNINSNDKSSNILQKVYNQKIIVEKTNLKLNECKNDFDEFINLMDNNIDKCNSNELFLSLNKSKDYINELSEKEIQVKEFFNNFHKSSLMILTQVMEFLQNMDILSNAIIEQSGSLDKIYREIGSISDVFGLKSDKTDKNSFSGKLFLYIENTENSIKSYDSSIQKVNEILSGIEELSVRTNLLAINASIEASHAGEFGKGFSIVAYEMRKLSESSSKLIQQVQTILKEIKTKTGSIINDIKDSRKSFENEISGLYKVISNLTSNADNVGEVTKKISSNYPEIIQLIGDMQNELENLKSASESCDNSIKNIFEISTIISQSNEDNILKYNSNIKYQNSLTEKVNLVKKRFEEIGKYTEESNE